MRTSDFERTRSPFVVNISGESWSKGGATYLVGGKEKSGS